MRYKGKSYKTIRELGEAVCEIAAAGDKDKAAEFLWFYALDTWEVRGCTFAEAEEICQKNIGYIAGYYSPAVMAAIFETFDVEHPIFGRRTDVTEQEALAAGMKLGEIAKMRGEDGGEDG